MNRYFSTFFTGFSKVINEALPESLSDVKIEKLVDGLVIYSTQANLEEIRKIEYFNNSFVLLENYEGCDENSVNLILSDALSNKNVIRIIREFPVINESAFRVRASVKNQFVSMDENLLVQFEDLIMRNNRNLVLDRRGAEIEFSINIRSEGFGLLGILFTQRPNYEKTLDKGELYPELGYLLNLVSKPVENGVFLDPFAGYGGILFQACKFNYQIVIGIDKQPVLAKKLEIKSSRLGLNTEIYCKDYFGWETEVGVVDRIVTDPPWGFFEKTDEPLEDFYSKTLDKSYLLLKNDGIIVILTAQTSMFDHLLTSLKNKFEKIDYLTTIVSGKIVGVYVLKKI